MNKYDPREIEPKWQNYWQENDTYRVCDTNEDEDKENHFILVEFVYPSGNLHVGHWYAFALPDIYARYLRMNGKNVLFPMGFDAFGLPAENAAISRGLDPASWTNDNIDFMQNQLKSMGASFDWNRSIRTCDPSYYKWTQWMFNQFFNNDLAYRDLTKVNWCDFDKTILANEQVVSGNCERCGNPVIQKDMTQWMLRITNFADELIDDLDDLQWDNSIKLSQKEWIGRKEGAEITFDIKGCEETISAFTTRADTLYGATYIVLAPEHPLLEGLMSKIVNQDEVNGYIDITKNKTERNRLQNLEKSGVQLKGLIAVNPATKAEIPIWIADYVLAGFGTGAVMAVPAHDLRDCEFAIKYDLPFKFVAMPSFDVKTKQAVGNGSFDFVDDKNLQTKDFINKVEVLLQDSVDGILLAGNRFCSTFKGAVVNSNHFNGLSSDDAHKQITETVSGQLKRNYRLRDWGISRQRFWGCPIPIVYDPQGNPHPVPDEHLPWMLPVDVDFTPDGTPPLARSQELLQKTEKIFGAGWTPETDTMDTFVDSAWYFYRYLDNANESEFASQEAIKNWMPVSMYFGGAEHTTLHLLYSRFWVKALHSLGIVPNKEPYDKRINRGLILGPDGNKMSKSKGNVIDPDQIVKELGADSVRMYLAFIGPYNQTGSFPWDPNGAIGIRKFLDRVWNLFNKVKPEQSDEALQKYVHKMIKKVSYDVEQLKFNTAISALMTLVSAAEKSNHIGREDYEHLVKMISIFAPYVGEEIWSGLLGNEGSVYHCQWPQYDESLANEDEITLGVQVNGKVRAQLTIAKTATSEQAQSMASEIPKIQSWIEGKQIVKFVYVPQRIINFVVK